MIIHILHTAHKPHGIVHISEGLALVKRFTDAALAAVISCTEYCIFASFPL